MIEQAVMETARGRWFLLEYARRQRAAETQRLADAVDRLEAIIERSDAATVEARLSTDVSPQPEPASATPAEGNAALAERLSDIAWRLREDGADPALCAELEHEAASLRPGPVESAVLAPKTAPPPLATPPWESTREKPVSDPAQDPRAKALARLDGLPILERLALFC